MGRTLHPRVMPYQAAQLELKQFVTDWIERHGLSFGEVLAALAEVQRTWAGVLVRSEREDESE